MRDGSDFAPMPMFRADVAGYRSVPRQIGLTAVFECKHAVVARQLSKKRAPRGDAFEDV